VDLKNIHSIIFKKASLLSQKQRGFFYLEERQQITQTKTYYVAL